MNIGEYYRKVQGEPSIQSWMEGSYHFQKSTRKWKYMHISLSPHIIQNHNKCFVDFMCWFVCVPYCTVHISELKVVRYQKNSSPEVLCVIQIIWPWRLYLINFTRINLILHWGRKFRYNTIQPIHLHVNLFSDTTKAGTRSQIKEPS